MIVVVPDVDLEPSNMQRPLDDLTARQQRVMDWEKLEVKEYKIIVLDLKYQEVTTHLFIATDFNGCLSCKIENLRSEPNFVHEQDTGTFGRRS